MACSSVWLEQYTHNVGVLGFFPFVYLTYFLSTFVGTHKGTHTTTIKDKNKR